jgi:hypothetical protein
MLYCVRMDTPVSELTAEQAYDLLWAWVSSGEPLPAEHTVPKLVRRLRIAMGYNSVKAFAHDAGQVQPTTVARWEDEDKRIGNLNRLHDSLLALRPRIKGEGPLSYEGFIKDRLKHSIEIWLMKLTTPFLVQEIPGYADMLLELVKEHKNDLQPFRIRYFYPALNPSLPNPHWSIPARSVALMKSKAQARGLTDYIHFHEIGSPLERGLVPVQRRARQSILSLASPLAGWFCLWGREQISETTERRFDLYLELQIDDPSARLRTTDIVLTGEHRPYPFLPVREDVKFAWLDTFRYYGEDAGVEGLGATIDQLIQCTTLEEASK